MDLDFLKEAKEKAIEQIRNSGMTKLEQLKVIEKNGIWGHSEYVNDEFPEWVEEAKELEKEKAQYDFDNGIADRHGRIPTYVYASGMTDTIFDPSTMDNEKYENVSYANSLERFFSDYEDENYDEDEKEFEGLYTVITTRGPNIKLQKTKDQIIDAVYDFCMANKIIGFKNDW